MTVCCPCHVQELKNLLLEAQKGPASLQEAIREQAGHHLSQQDELRGLIDTLKVTVHSAASLRRKDGEATLSPSAPVMVPPPTAPLPHPQPCPSDKALKELTVFSQRTQSLLESLQPQVGQVIQGITKLESELMAVRGLMEVRQQAEKRAEQQFDPQPARMEEPARMEGAEMVVKSVEQTQRRLEGQISRNAMYNAVFTYTAAALTVPVLYLLLRGTG